jgi:predicted CXXCH cytochrome family protein
MKMSAILGLSQSAEVQMNARISFRFLSAAILLTTLVSACTDEKTIFVERPLFDDPPSAAHGFLGFDNQAEKLTVCGNCHVGQQAKWEGTHHADAWATLENSGSSQAFCQNCHSVGPNGNPTTGAVGYAGIPDDRYHDVQCESCHGPGLNHVTNPDASQPLASIAIFETSEPTKNCAECHSGVHHPFAIEWAASRHATFNSSARDNTSPLCLSCHSGQGALAAWGVTANYVEKSDPRAQHVGITCAVCHDPHSRTNPAQLRFPIDVPDENVNLCMKCHNRRSNPEVTAQAIRGPHAPEGPLLLGEAGWWPPGFEPEVDRIVATHGTTGNPRLCASCHVSSFEVTDPVSGDHVFSATGHLFKAVPCLDENGVPLPEEDCPVTERTFESCAQSGCHGTPEAARSAFLTANGRIEDLVDEVTRLLTLVPPAEFNLNDGIFTVADGAWFNAELAAKLGSPTHNPFLTEQLLVASINALEDTYGVSASSGVSLERMYR